MILTVSTQSPVDSLLPYRPAATLSQLEIMRQQSERTLTQTPPADVQHRAWELGNLAGITFSLGDGPAALDSVQRAIRAAEESAQVGLRAYLQNTLGAVLCYQGQYAQARAAFQQAERIFAGVGDSLGAAWNQHLLAREYLRDWREYREAIRYLDMSLPVLRSRGNPEVIVEHLLTRASCLLPHGEVRHARELLAQAEGVIVEGKCYWYRPELYLLRAEISILENEIRKAWQHCYDGLGMISDHGDLRLLPAIYLTLATALEYDRTRIDDARDALERSINAARTRGRKLNLALALRKMGQHLKRFSVRPTTRARGAGFLFEAAQLFREMGLSEVYSA